MPPQVSVIICTLDRVNCLPACLESLCDQVGIDRAEVIVVNDGPTDRTLDIVEQGSSRLNIRYVKAGFRSLGKARNLGLHEATSPVVAYLDDDATAEPGWLASLTVDFASSDFAGQTGPVTPNGSWDEANQWLHPAVARQLFSLAADRPVSIDLHYPDCLLGCNMAFKHDFLIRCGGFSPDIQSYDEAFVVWPAMKHGHRFFFNRNMRARHRIDPRRLDPQFIWKKFRGQGAAYQRLIPTLRHQGLRSSPLLLESLRSICGYMVSSLLHDKQKQTAFTAQIAFALGRLQSFMGHIGDYYEKPEVVRAGRL